MSDIHEDKELLIAQSINRFLFQKVWNEPGRERRNNILPMMLSTRSVNGAIRIYGEYIDLPTSTEPYYIYAAAKPTMYGVAFPRMIGNEWLSTEELLTKHDIMLSVYHTTGIMMHKGSVYIKQLPKGNGYIIAINKKMSSKLLVHEEMKNIRFTVYYDSDLINKINCTSFLVPYPDYNYAERNRIVDVVNGSKNKDSVICYINGYESKIESITNLSPNDYVDVIIDDNTTFSFDIDLTDTSSNVVFLSDMDKTYKQLIHIPKKYNPENKVYTHNTMDFFVRKKLKNEDRDVIEGLYLHRCADRSVTQVTHNDVAIPLYILDAYRDYLSTQDVTLHVVVRQHSKDNVLIRDKNYIDLLYTQDDSLIIQHLLGKVSKDLDFWKASNLESSVYVQTMFDVPNVVTPSNMSYYVDGLGYYHIMSLLCERVIRFTASDAYSNVTSIQKPYVYQGSEVYPIVTLNGSKIKDDKVTFNNADSATLTVSVDKTIKVNPGDELSIEVFLHGNTNFYRFTPSVSNTTITVPYRDFIVVEELNTVITDKKYDKTLTKGYTLLKETSGNLAIVNSGSNSSTITFGSTLYNRTFILEPNEQVHHFEYTEVLDKKISNGDPLVFELSKNAYDGETTDDDVNIPIYLTPTTLLYLNSRYLIKGIDYTIQDIYDYNKHLCLKVLVIQNVSYLKDNGNLLEVYVTSTHEENRVYGYTVDDRTYATDNNISLYFPNMTALNVEGYSESHGVDKGNYIALPSGKYRNGSPYETRTSVPTFVSDYLNKYHVNDDLDRIKILNAYFYGTDSKYPDIILLEKSHNLYSVYTAMIIRDVVNGDANLTYDPDTKRMKAQLAKYQYIADNDLITNLKVDLRFIDAYPHYKEYSVDAEMYKVIHAFIAITMPNDPISNKQDPDITAP